MYLASIGLLFAGYVIGGSFHGYGAGIGVQDGKMRHGSQVAGLAYGTRVNEYGLFMKRERLTVDLGIRWADEEEYDYIVHLTT